MSEEKKNQVIEKILQLFSNFGESLINIESQLNNLNQTVRRLEHKVNELAKLQKEDVSSVESEYKRLEKDLNSPIFTNKELKDLQDLENEYKDLEKDLDANGTDTIDDIE